MEGHPFLYWEFHIKVNETFIILANDMISGPTVESMYGNYVASWAYEVENNIDGARLSSTESLGAIAVFLIGRYSY